MQMKDFSTHIKTTKSAQEIYLAITDVPAWWTEDFQGSAKRLNDVFTVTFGDTFITVKVVEMIAFSRVGWQVIDCHKHFLRDKKEWVGTKICFELIDSENGYADVTFTHFGLVSPLECYQVCVAGWNKYLHGSLDKLIHDGIGMSDVKEVVTK